MHHVDRSSGILHEEEKFSLDERQEYQEKFLRGILGVAYTAGTPLKAALDQAGAKPDDIRTIADLAKLPIIKKKELSEAQKANPPFGGFLTVPMSDLLRVHQSNQEQRDLRQESREARRLRSVVLPQYQNQDQRRLVDSRSSYPPA